MKSEIIAFACGCSGGVFGFKSKDCGPRGIVGGVASKFSSRNSHASATLPTPMALRARKRRRDHNRSAAAECRIVFMSLVSRMDEGDRPGNSKRTDEQRLYLAINT